MGIWNIIYLSELLYSKEPMQNRIYGASSSVVHDLFDKASQHTLQIRHGRPIVFQLPLVFLVWMIFHCIDIATVGIPEGQSATTPRLPTPIVLPGDGDTIGFGILAAQANLTILANNVTVR